MKFWSEKTCKGGGTKPGSASKPSGSGRSWIAISMTKSRFIWPCEKKKTGEYGVVETSEGAAVDNRHGGNKRGGPPGAFWIEPDATGEAEANEQKS